jgi:hypothetical protein
MEVSVFNVLTDPGKKMSYTPESCRRLYKIPVVNRTAIVRIRYNSSNAVPEGTGVEIPVLVRNLTVAIVVSPGNAVVPLNGKVDEVHDRSFARLRGDRIEDVDRGRGLDGCRPEKPGEPGEMYRIVCNNIWLLPEGTYPAFHPFGLFHEGDRFLFCYRVSGWVNVDPENKQDGKGCPLRASPSQNKQT